MVFFSLGSGSASGASGAPEGMLRATLTQGKANPGKRVQGLLFYHLDQTSLRIASLCNSRHQPINHLSTPVSFALSHLEVSFLPLATEKKKGGGMDSQTTSKRPPKTSVVSKLPSRISPHPIPFRFAPLRGSWSRVCSWAGCPGRCPQHALLVMEACTLLAPAPISRNTSSR